MANNSKKHKKQALLARAILLSGLIFLVVYMLTVLSASGDFFTESAKKNVQPYFYQELQITEQLAEVHYDNLYEIADRLQYATSTEEVETVMASYIGSEQFGNLHFFSQGQTYTVGGAPIGDSYGTSTAIAELAASKKRGCTGIYRDTFSGYDCLSFFVPVRGSVVVDGVLSIIQARNIISLKDILSEKTAVALLVDSEGIVLTATAVPGFEAPVGSDLYDFLASITVNKLQLTEPMDALQAGTPLICAIDATGCEYTLSMSPVAAMSNQYSLVTLTKSELLIGSETEYIRHVVMLILISMIFLSVGLVAIFTNRKNVPAAANAATQDTDPLLGCPTLEQFKQTARAALRERQRSIAVCVFEIRQFQSGHGDVQSADTTEMLQHVAKTLSSFCSPVESYSYMGGGKFVHLLACTGETILRDRVRLVEAIANKNAILGKTKANKKFNVGVSLSINAPQCTIEELIDQAVVACSKSKSTPSVPYVIYTEQVSQDKQQSDRIEAEMESALANGEFRLFLQPKYNIADDCIDSAEGLVRWFDPKTGDYRFPGEFIGLFETNGFIVKLDQFIYVEALKTLSTALERGEKAVPISVNVSMVTVSAPGFLNFYIQNKKKYQVPDGYMIVEFSESSASDQDNRMHEIVTQLQRNGIRCSMDNFGRGYASLTALKNVPLDEIKLDRTFLKPGFSQDRDDAIVQTLVSLAKSMGIRVVQEGVETKEMFDISIARGCDIIQGYYYAKGIPVEEYRLFIKSNTSIRYKAQVK